MRLSPFILVALLAGCTQTRDRVSSVSGSGDEVFAVVQQLSDQPPWLFPISECPGDVMPASESRIQHSAKDCALNPEDCLQSCIAENGSACYGLALLFQERKIESQYSEALFLRACKLGIASGCTNRAAGMLNLERENNDSAALSCIARTFEKTCDRKDPWGCTMYGFVLSQGIGCDRDIEKALEVLPLACERDSRDPACQHARSLEQLLRNQ
ncbi:MAG: sel1 repeat family protein [Spirulina sp.]